MTNMQIAEYLVAASSDEGTIQAADMLRIATDPTMHTTCRLRYAAERLGVLAEVAALCGWDDSDI